MKRIFLLLILSIALFSETNAQSKKDSIKILFVLMQQDSLINKSFATMTSSIVSSIASQIKDTAFSNRYSKVIERSMENSRNIARKLINEDMVDIYDKYFTQEEINDFIVFYKSKSGQKMISTISDIQKDIMSAMSTKYTPGLQQEIMKEIDQVMKEAREQQ